MSDELTSVGAMHQAGLAAAALRKQQQRLACEAKKRASKAKGPAKAAGKTKRGRGSNSTATAKAVGATTTDELPPTASGALSLAELKKAGQALQGKVVEVPVRGMLLEPCTHYIIPGVVHPIPYTKYTLAAFPQSK
jgi:hypothetical protein